jgi:hypothetical protein
MNAKLPHIVFEPDDAPELRAVLQGLRSAMARYPIAFQAGYSALVREGRTFAATEEGAAALATLRRSPLVALSRLVWRTLSMGAFTECEADVLPSTYLDAVLRTISLEQLEPVLSRLFEPGED